MSTYGYVGGSPLDTFDPDGLGACKVEFPDYPIPVAGNYTIDGLGGGHAGVIGYDSNGVTNYYEYGRYPQNGAGNVGVSLPQDDGNVRKVSIPNVKVGPDVKALSKKSGHDTRAELTCSANVDEKKVSKYAIDVGKNKDRPKYSWVPWHSNTCQTFAQKAIDAGTPNDAK
jgi:hypothetical protein